MQRELRERGLSGFGELGGDVELHKRDSGRWHM